MKRDLVDIARELQGGERQVQFAARLGTNQSELSRFLRRRRNAPPQLVAGLLRLFPERRDEIVEAWTAERTPAQAAS